MTFWERHKSAILFGGAVLFIFAVIWLSLLRTKYESAENLRAEQAKLHKELSKFYFRLNKDEKAQKEQLHNPTLAELKLITDRRRREFEDQLKKLINDVRFPFSTEFPWAEIRNNPAFEAFDGMSYGVYVNRRYPLTRQNVENYGVGRGRVTQLNDNWLRFIPSSAPASVTLAKAEDNLRRLALAEKITKLAIDSGISWVLKVSPAKVEPDGAYYWGRSGHKRVRKAYKNKFILNYPVQVQMIGSLDSVMKFFYSICDQKRFLVVRNFEILGSKAETELGASRDIMKPGEVLVNMSAACMDFVDDKNKSANTKPEVTKTSEDGPDKNYKPPRKPLGH
jgi:hypothetical protein